MTEILGSPTTDAAFDTYQARVDKWLLACFGEEIARDREERNHRFIEEALELVQTNGCTRSEAHQLVDYVYGRPVGELYQEVGGVMVTLAAFCLANDLDMHQEAETELARINRPETIEKIRAKQAAKPKHSPLPEVPAQPRSHDANSALVFTYRNYRGEVAQRSVRPISVRFGATEWHPEPQWLMLAFDVEKRPSASSRWPTCQPAMSLALRPTAPPTPNASFAINC